MAQYPDYVARVTADEGAIGRGHLSKFQDLETKTPVILTSSQLLTTGVDAPTCKNVVLARIVGSMSEFKQIIGRGTRLRDDYGKLWFNILDYTGSATRMFADPDFDGDPARITEEEVNDAGEATATTEIVPEGQEPEPVPPEEGEPGVIEPPTGEPRKFYFDGGQVEVVAHLVHELDPNGRQLRVVKYTDYAAESVRSLAPTSADVRKRWADADQRSEIIAALAERGIDFDVTGRTGRSDRRRTLSTCFAIWPSMLRFAPGASGRSASNPSARTISRSSHPRRVRCSTSFWKNMRNTATRSLSCRTCSRFRRSQPTASPPKSSSCSVAPMSFAGP